MDDADFLDLIERRVMYVMFSGCEVDDHLYNKTRDVGSWSISLRADEVGRLLDIAKRGTDAQAQ